MKKIISLIVCAVMVIPCFMFAAFAADEEKVDYNIAPDGSTYATSNWNNDSNSRWLIDGDTSSTWQFWRPGSKDQEDGRNATVDDANQYFGVKFTKYYEFNKVVLYVLKYDNKNNVSYTLKALVMGEWIELKTLRNSDITDTYKVKDWTFGKITFELPEYITTKNIRICLSDYGINSGGNGNFWDVPMVEEMEVNGKEGTPPPFDVPEGAVLSTNAVLGGMSSASSTVTWAALACDDNKSGSYWQAENETDGEWWMTEFDKAHPIDSVSINFGGSIDGISFTYDIFLLGTDGKWTKVVDGQKATTTAEVCDSMEFPVSPTQEATALKVTFTGTDGGAALISEVGARIADDGKCIFLADYMSTFRQESTAAGNIACYGTPYASSTLGYAGAAYVEYINDGKFTNDSPSWFANTRAAGEYCGVILKEKHLVSKVVLYFNDVVTGNIEGDHVLSFKIQVKDGDDYVTVGKGTSYDTSREKYIASIELDRAVETDDVRVVFTSNGLLFPYVKEIEVYEDGFIYGGYDGYPTDSVGGAPLTKNFADKTVAHRAKILDIKSPIATFYTIMDMQRKAAIASYAV